LREFLERGHRTSVPGCASRVDQEAPICDASKATGLHPGRSLPAIPGARPRRGSVPRDTGGAIRRTRGESWS
jgi:hypothetical protein